MISFTRVFPSPCEKSPWQSLVRGAASSGGEPLGSHYSSKYLHVSIDTSTTSRHVLFSRLGFALGRRLLEHWRRCRLGKLLTSRKSKIKSKIGKCKSIPSIIREIRGVDSDSLTMLLSPLSFSRGTRRRPTSLTSDTSDTTHCASARALLCWVHWSLCELAPKRLSAS